MEVVETGEAITSALLQRQPGKGLLHQSDRGSQYASGEYQRIWQRIISLAV